MGVVAIDDRDASIQYIGNWELGGNATEYKSTTHGTKSVGAFAIFKFKGSLVSVYGTLLRGIDKTPTASYSIDGSTPAVVKGMPREDVSMFKQRFYKSPPLDPSKEHTLIITLTGTDGNKLWLDYFEVEDENMATSTQAHSSQLASLSSSSRASPSTVQISQTATKVAQTQLSSQSSGTLPKNTIIGIAVGSAVGGLLVASLVAVLFYCLRRKYKGKMGDKLEGHRVTAFLTPIGRQDISNSPGVFTYMPEARGGSKRKDISPNRWGGRLDSSLNHVSGTSESLPSYQSITRNAISQEP